MRWGPSPQKPFARMARPTHRINLSLTEEMPFDPMTRPPARLPALGLDEPPSRRVLCPASRLVTLPTYSTLKTLPTDRLRNSCAPTNCLPRVSLSPNCNPARVLSRADLIGFLGPGACRLRGASMAAVARLVLSALPHAHAGQA